MFCYGKSRDKGLEIERDGELWMMELSQSRIGKI